MINFGMLAVLKYLHPLFEGFLIPLGISFYMFISIGYLVDIYFEKYEAENESVSFSAVCFVFSTTDPGTDQQI